MVEHGVVVGTARSSARRSEAPEVGIILMLAIIAIHTHCVSCLNALIIASVTNASPAGYWFDRWRLGQPASKLVGIGVVTVTIKMLGFKHWPSILVVLSQLHEVSNALLIIHFLLCGLFSLRRKRVLLSLASWAQWAIILVVYAASSMSQSRALLVSFTIEWPFKHFLVGSRINVKFVVSVDWRIGVNELGMLLTYSRVLVSHCGFLTSHKCYMLLWAFSLWVSLLIEVVTSSSRGYWLRLLSAWCGRCGSKITKLIFFSGCQYSIANHITHWLIGLFSVPNHLIDLAGRHIWLIVWIRIFSGIIHSLIYFFDTFCWDFLFRRGWFDFIECLKPFFSILLCNFAFMTWFDAALHLSIFLFWFLFSFILCFLVMYPRGVQFLRSFYDSLLFASFKGLFETINRPWIRLLRRAVSRLPHRLI